MIPPHKWNIQKFTGDSKGTSVTAFFEIFDVLRVARNVPKVILFDSGMDLFANWAYQFYKDCRSRVNNWDELESIGVHLAVMASYFNRLGCPMTEEAKLNVITRNLHPFYQDRLREPLPIDLSELRTICRRMESRKDLINCYVEPSSRRANVLEKDLAFVELEEINALEVATAQQAYTSNQAKQIVCYRCNSPGHKTIGCAMPRRLQCFGCRKEGFTKNNCQNCSTEGNGRGHP
ncbi:hypothetical protein JTB14_004484 [Gonioctena quinquepunctata]|nr:hypothetical protein JTB14_004484 [Gonioctena quinquepunctata]